MRGPVDQRAERLSRLTDTLAQNSPQADALIAPELLTVMAGGQGSGLRMNEAEIARIIGGRTQWESIKAKVQAWQTNPDRGFSLTPPQRQQVRTLLNAVQARVSQKLQAFDAASEMLANTDDARQHRAIMNGLQSTLTAIDNTGTEGNSGSTTGGRFSKLNIRGGANAGGFWDNVPGAVPLGGK